jgi:hypothetical protein
MKRSYEFLAFENYATIAITFDLWKLKIGFDMFALVVNFIHKEWVPYHITIGLFDAPHTSKATLIEQLKKKYFIYKKIKDMNPSIKNTR